MIIEQPRIRFSNSKRAFQQFAADYNKDKPSREQLKTSHFVQFYTYVRLLERNIAQNNVRAINNGVKKAMALDTDDQPHLFTRNNELAKQMDGGHPSTFLRRYERLAEAGAVRKINHGRYKDYEIIINPHLLYIYDETGAPACNRPDLEKARNWAVAWDSGCAESAKCTVDIVSFGNNSNKEIIEKKESGKPDSVLINISKDTSKDTQKDTTGNLADTETTANKKSDFGNLVLGTLKGRLDALKNNPEKKLSDKLRKKWGLPPVAQQDNGNGYHLKLEKKEKELKKLRLQYAALMVQMMIDYLLKDITVYQGERDRTISYVAENYFGHCITYSSVLQAWSGYAARLEEARRYKERHPDYHPFPYYYFNKENVANGFESERWRSRSLQFKKLKKWRTGQDKLQAAIRRINKEPGRETFERELQYVKDNIPEMKKAFFRIIYTEFPQLIVKQ